MEGRVRCGKLESSEAASRGINENQRTKFHHLLNFPMPDYGKIPPKVDCWREKTQKWCGKREGSGTRWYITKEVSLREFPYSNTRD
jgi:hypothetical protein